MLGAEPGLDLALLLLLDLRQLLFGGIVGCCDLIKRVLGALFELLFDPFFLLIEPQARTTAVCLHLFQSPFLELCVGRLETTFRMPVDLVIVGSGQRQRVKRVVDTRCIERRKRTTIIIELRNIQPPALLDRRLGVFGCRSPRSVFLFLSEKSISFGLLFGRLCLLRSLSFPGTSFMQSVFVPPPWPSLKQYHAWSIVGRDLGTLWSHGEDHARGISAHYSIQLSRCHTQKAPLVALNMTSRS